MIQKFDWDQHPIEMLELEYENYLNLLFETLIVNENLEDGEDPLPEPPTESGTDFCGCDICCTRETMAFLMPRFITLYEQGYIRKLDASSASTSDH